MTKIYAHEYTITSMERSKMGIRAVTIEIVSETTEAEGLEAVASAMKLFDQNLNISHRIILEGYRND